MQTLRYLWSRKARVRRAKALGLTVEALAWRLHHWPLEDALTVPYGGGRLGGGDGPSTRPLQPMWRSTRRPPRTISRSWGRAAALPPDAALEAGEPLAAAEPAATRRRLQQGPRHV